ncbi:MAG: FlgD immunoglobulin-like domain containing protein, partial [Dehalococcoidales bacterium]|nr:FlgD immunoglobulin-like domain containing protein [Dehalococcoidales bacterium]
LAEMLAPGKHTVSVYAEDVVENKTEFKWEFTVDNEAPKATTLTPANNAITNVGKPVISCLLSDVGGGVDPQTVELYLDNNKVISKYDELSGRVVYIPSTLIDGLHNVKLKGKDIVGEQVIVEWKFSVDTHGPVAEQYYPLPGSFYNGAKAAFVKIIDSISGTTGDGLKAKLDGNPIECSYDSNGTVTLSNAITWQEGNHEFIVLCQDNAGNKSELKWSFKVDLTPPAISSLVNSDGISIAVDKPILLFSLTDSFSGVDPKTIAVKYNDQLITCSYEATTGQLLYQPAEALLDGILKFTITVKDVAGNSTSFDKNTAVDTTPPVISEITPANGVFLNNPNPDISALIQDAGVGIDLTSVSLKIDGKANTFAYDKSVEKVNTVISNIKKVKGQVTSGWSEGWHTAEIQVKDLNGNQAVVNWSFLIDTVAPAISNIKLQDNFVSGDYTSARPEIKFGLFDQTSGIDVDQVKVILNNEAKNCSVQEIVAPDWKGSYCPTTDLPSGTYTATVEAFDRANNKSISQEIVFVVSNEINAEKVINYPNPFKDDTKFTYILPSTVDEVRIEVYDLNGELVYETGDGSRQAGYNETFWNGKNRYGEDIANGVYIYRLIIRGDGQEKIIKKKIARLR